MGQYEFRYSYKIGDKFSRRGDEVTVHTINFYCYKHLSGSPYCCFVSYGVKTSEGKGRIYREPLSSSEKSHSLTFFTAYDIGQKVWVLKQNKKNPHLYYTQEARIDEICITREKEYPDTFDYIAYIDGDVTRPYVKDTITRYDPDIFYSCIFYDTLEKAEEAVKERKEHYEKLKAQGGFY